MEQMNDLLDYLEIGQFYARLFLEDKAKRQPLKTHLRNVAKKALEFAKDIQPINPDDSPDARQSKEAVHNTALNAGLLHDLGKYRKQFQEYLLGKRGRSNKTDHSAYGSAAALHRFHDDSSAFAIAGHHAGLHDLGNLDSLINGTKYEAFQKYAQLLTLAQDEKELGAFTEFYPIPIDEPTPASAVSRVEKKFCSLGASVLSR